MATIKTSLFHVISWSIEATCSKDERKIESNRIKVDIRRATPRAMRTYTKKKKKKYGRMSETESQRKQKTFFCYHIDYISSNETGRLRQVSYNTCNVFLVFFLFTYTLKRWHMYSRPKCSFIYNLFVRLIFDCCCWLHFFISLLGRLGKYKCIHLLIVDI